MVAGRPREHDRALVMEEMMKWAVKPDSINLNGFCFLHLIPLEKISLWSKQDDEFRQVVSLVKCCLASKREMLVSQGLLHQRAYDLNAKVYDKLIKEEWQESLKFEMEVKTAISAATTKELDDAHNKLMAYITENQEALKASDMRMRAEQKS